MTKLDELIITAGIVALKCDQPQQRMKELQAFRKGAMWAIRRAKLTEKDLDLRYREPFTLVDQKLARADWAELMGEEE